VTAPAIIAGRQPIIKRWTPSGPSPWYGTIIGGELGQLGETGGEPFTAQQIATLRDMGLNPETVERILVKRNAKFDEATWNIGQVPPQFHMECPIVGRRRGGNITVIAPAGWTVDVNPDGWSGSPGKPKRPF
jgi:hypothetical protein